MRAGAADYLSKPFSPRELASRLSGTRGGNPVKNLYTRIAKFLSVEHPSVGLKQLPLTVAFVVSLVVLLLVPGVQISNLLLATIGIVLLFVATVLAAVFTMNARRDRWAIIVPLLDFLAIGAYRTGTGATLSLLGAMVVLPVVWVAAEKGAPVHPDRRRGPRCRADHALRVGGHPIHQRQ